MIILKKKIRRETIAQLCLVIGTFFNPFGFDFLFAFTTKLTGSYFITDVIFYGVALLFFGFYFLLSRKKTKPESYL
jgi:hypothetical protein